MGEAFNVVGDVGEGKNCGGAEKIHGGAISWGLLQRGVNEPWMLFYLFQLLLE